MSGAETGADRTLEASLRRAPMTTDEAISAASTVAEEVAALHAAGRAHGGIAPSTVAIDEDGVARLIGPPAPKTGPAAPPALRAEDLHGVGRVLAATLGWPDRKELPTPVADLVARAEAADAPASALATAVRRLAREPQAVAALLPQLAPPVPARQEDSFGGTLLRLIPRADRRTTGTAALVVAGAAAVGAMLLLIGTPASTGRGPDAAAEVRPSASAAAPTAGGSAAVADAPPRSVQAILRSGVTRVQPIPARAPEPVTRVETPAADRTAPAVRPTSTPTAAPTSSAPAPAPSASAPAAAPTDQPTAVPTQDPAPEPTADPTAPPSAPEPTPPAAPSAAPTAAPTPDAAPPSPAAG